MKKIIILILCLSVIFIPKVNAKEKVNVYLFWEYNCSICENFLEDLRSENSDKFQIIFIDVSLNTDNKALFLDVVVELDVSDIDFPFVVIGNEFFSNYNTSNDDEIKNVIMEQYESGSVLDIVDSKIDIRLKDNMEIEKEEIKDGVFEANIYPLDDESDEEFDEFRMYDDVTPSFKYTNLVCVVGVFLLILVSGIIYSTKKRKKLSNK